MVESAAHIRGILEITTAEGYRDMTRRVSLKTTAALSMERYPPKRIVIKQKAQKLLHLRFYIAQPR